MRETYGKTCSRRCRLHRVLQRAATSSLGIALTSLFSRGNQKTLRMGTQTRTLLLNYVFGGQPIFVDLQVFLFDLGRRH